MSSDTAPEATAPVGADAGQRRTALVSVFAAGALVALKLGTGLVTGSLGLVSAGIESSGDVVAAVLTLFAIRLGGRPADANHPYGHRRAENLAALGEAAILTGGGIVVVVEAIGRLTGGGEPFETHWYVFAVIAIALAVDVSRVLVSLRGAAKYKSAALRSNAFHFAGDMAGSLAVLAGLRRGRGGLSPGRRDRRAARGGDHLRRRRPADRRERARADGHDAGRSARARARGDHRARRRHRAAAAAGARIGRPLLRRRRRRGPARPGGRRGPGHHRRHRSGGAQVAAGQRSRRPPRAAPRGPQPARPRARGRARRAARPRCARHRDLQHGGRESVSLHLKMDPTSRLPRRTRSPNAWRPLARRARRR